MEQSCIFCYKSTRDFIASDERVSVLKNFFVQIRKYFMLTAEASGFRNWVIDTSGFFRQLDDATPTNCCVECFCLVEKFCNVNTQWMLLQLELDWMVVKIRKIMRIADSIPSRVTLFKEEYRNDPLQLERIMDNRMAFKKLCKINHMARFPRVLISPITLLKRENEHSTEMEDEEHTIVNVHSAEENNNYFTDGGIQEEQVNQTEHLNKNATTVITEHNLTNRIAVAQDFPEGSFEIKPDRVEKGITNGKILKRGTVKNLKQRRINKISRQHVRKTRSNDKGDRGPIENIRVTPSGLTVNDIVLNRKCAFTCKVENCQSRFREKEDLTQHSKLHGHFSCKFCAEVKTFALDLSIHEMSHSQGTSKTAFLYCCARCDFQAKTQNVYIEHPLKEHLHLTMDTKKCPICRHCYGLNGISKNVNAKARVLKHYLDMHTLKKREIAKKCNKCPAFFSTLVGLQKHKQEIHTLSRIEHFKCDDCEFVCGQHKILFEHRTSAHKLIVHSWPHVCTNLNCGKRFEKQIDLEYHIWSTHGRESTCHLKKRRRLLCIFCSRRYRKKRDLYEHLREHVEERPFICRICGVEFLRQGLLKSHVSIKHSHENV